MEIGYIERRSGELIIEKNLQSTPIKMYPPSEYKKANEMASVKVRNT